MKRYLGVHIHGMRQVFALSGSLSPEGTWDPPLHDERFGAFCTDCLTACVEVSPGTAAEAAVYPNRLLYAAGIAYTGPCAIVGLIIPCLGL